MRVIEGQAQIDYPTEWRYKVIGENREQIIQAIDEVLNLKDYKLRDSHSSRTGKFISLQLSLIVENEQERNRIFISLKNHHNIKIVI